MKKWEKWEEDYLRNNPSKTNAEIAKHLKRSKISVARKRQRNVKPINEIKESQKKQEESSYRSKYNKAVNYITELENKLKKSVDIKKLLVETYKIEPVLANGKSESTAVVLLSDWHIDEIVRQQAVNYLNKFDSEVASQRIEGLFQTIVKFIDLHKNETKINTVILALLGDFISGGIHDELKESNILLPVEAIWSVQSHLASGIKYILENTDVKIVLPCSVGNHSRITEKQRVSTEFGNSLEWLMYKNLGEYFLSEKRVKFVINEGYHTYIDVYDYTIRFHHGHAIRYAGGVGGIYIPVKKAIAQWNKGKYAHLDCFGHYHQMKNDGQFISNGSLIGWNAFAIRIKADYETPRQAFFLISKEKKRFITVVRPIILK